MSESMIIKEEIIFKSSREKVWELLTKPELTRQYMFGCELISEWQIGSEVIWQGQTEDGQKVNYVKGKLLEFELHKKLVTNTFDPNSEMPDIPENYVNFSYELEDVTEGTKLTIIQGGFAGAENGQKRFEESKAGWSQMVVPTMKSLLE